LKPCGPDVPARIANPSFPRSFLCLLPAVRGRSRRGPGWTMTPPPGTFTAEGPAYNQLLSGLFVLALTTWLCRLLARRSIFMVAENRAARDRFLATGKRFGRLRSFQSPASGTSAAWWIREQQPVERVSLERHARPRPNVLRPSDGLSAGSRNESALHRGNAPEGENALASSILRRKEHLSRSYSCIRCPLDALLRDLLEMNPGARTPISRIVELPRSCSAPSKPIGSGRQGKVRA